MKYSSCSNVKNFITDYKYWYGKIHSTSNPEEMLLDIFERFPNDFKSRFLTTTSIDELNNMDEFEKIAERIERSMALETESTSSCFVCHEAKSANENMLILILEKLNELQQEVAALKVAKGKTCFFCKGTWPICGCISKCWKCKKSPCACKHESGSSNVMKATFNSHGIKNKKKQRKKSKQIATCVPAKSVLTPISHDLKNQENHVDIDDQVKIEQFNDQETRRIKYLVRNGKLLGFKIKKSLVYKTHNNQELLFVPKSLRMKISKFHHGNSSSSKQDSKQVFANLNKSYWWKNMTNEINDYQSCCDVRAHESGHVNHAKKSKHGKSIEKAEFGIAEHKTKIKMNIHDSYKQVGKMDETDEFTSSIQKVKHVLKSSPTCLNFNTESDNHDYQTCSTCLKVFKINFKMNEIIHKKLRLFTCSKCVFEIPAKRD